MEYWSDEGVSTMVKDMNIQIVRAAMATGDEDWWGCKNGGECGDDPTSHMRGYQVDKEYQTNLMKTVVEAAIKQDIYVIIDWHSHKANTQTEASKSFFAEMAQAYGQYDHVIFELFNEPEKQSWSEVKSYANQVIPEIRKYSDNLIIVGNPEWDQNPQQAIGNEVTDSKNNTAYALHYYAMSHKASGNLSWGGPSEGDRGLQAMKAGLSLFISEWGTGSADGKGTPGQSENQAWQTYVDQYKLSWANWSASHINEGTAAFASGSNKNNLQYSASGNMVKGFLATNPETYTRCPTANIPDPQPGEQPGDAIIGIKAPNGLSVAFLGKSIEVSGVKAANVELFDLKGNKLMMIDGVSGNLSLAAVPAGQYLVKVTAGSASKTQMVNLK